MTASTCGHRHPLRHAGRDRLEGLAWTGSSPESRRAGACRRRTALWLSGQQALLT